MLLAKVECKNIEVEKLASYLSKLVRPFFTVWLYDNKAYAAFKVNSISQLKDLIDELRENKHLRLKFYRIEMVDHG